MAKNNIPKLIAFYLPQYHPIPSANPLFSNHYQPRLPADLGFYDLRLSGTQEAQAELARRYYIHGFCYYYYWFDGYRLLEKPLNNMLSSSIPDFPFCICWANENWTRRWDGHDQDVLMSQNYDNFDAEKFILDVIPILKDSRYIRIGGRPILLIYRVNLIPNILDVVAIWRKICAEHGIAELFLCAVQSLGFADPRPFGFDAAVEFPPHGHFRNPDIRSKRKNLSPSFSGKIFDYKHVVKRSLERKKTEYRLFRGVMPSWDNTARKKDRAYIYSGSSPELYEEWLRSIIRDSSQGEANSFVFINAWNEWAECKAPVLCTTSR